MKMVIAEKKIMLLLWFHIICSNAGHIRADEKNVSIDDYSYVVYFIIALIFLLIYRWFLIKRTQQKSILEKERFERKKTEELEKLKSGFFSNLSNEFRTPISMNIRQMEELTQDSDLPQTTKDKLQVVLKSSYRLLNLTNELVDPDKLDKQPLTPDDQYYPKEPSLVSRESLSSKFDEEFMKKVTAFIENNLTNSGLSVDQLAQCVSLSKVQTYRKIKAITGLSIVEFIRTIRLKKAAQLISEKQMSFSEISFETGFSTPSYFSKCFHDHFGKTPSEYASDNG